MILGQQGNDTAVIAEKLSKCDIVLGVSPHTIFTKIWFDF
jgi:hypothetical protein